MKKKYFQIKNKIKLYYQINWLKTIYINFYFFSFKDAIQFPIIIFGQCSFASLKGSIVLKAPIRTGIITLGHRFEIFKKSANSAELFLEGDWLVKGNIQFGYDFKIYVENDAVFETGHMCTLANNTKIVCSNKIIFGDHVKIGDESQLIDTNFHNMFDTITNKEVPKKGEIYLSSYISTGSRVTIMKNAKIPSYSLITSNSLCNKDFLSFGENNVFGGIPAQFIKNGLIRDWKSEEQKLVEYLTVKL